METLTPVPRQSTAGLTTFELPATLESPLPSAGARWALWQRMLFRFFFVYLVIQIAPWNWFFVVPGSTMVLGPWARLTNWIVRTGNGRFFHVRDQLVPTNGSGDTSYAWAQLCAYLSLAAIACVLWSVLDRKRENYDRLAFWLRQIVRYYIAAAALGYGIIKLFLLQMSFPQLSQLATPLGDLLPMRFSWLFIGYSGPYQFFSGAMETIAGLLLLYRRTITAGLFAATGAFANVVMINIAYDVPVKLYAMHLLFACLFLLVLDGKRMVNLLVLNRAVPPLKAYDFNLAKRWQRIGVNVVKVFMLYQILYQPLANSWMRYRGMQQLAPSGPFKAGVYDVRSFVRNRDTLSVVSADTLRWRDVIIDNIGAGSVSTGDQVFWQRYGRGYFRYRPDTAARTVAVWKTSTIPRDSTFLFTMRYESPDTNTIRFHTAIRGDSVHVELVRVPRHFQLTERQFHWLSEYNR